MRKVVAQARAAFLVLLLGLKRTKKTAPAGAVFLVLLGLKRAKNVAP